MNWWNLLTLMLFGAIMFAWWYFAKWSIDEYGWLAVGVIAVFFFGLAMFTDWKDRKAARSERLLDDE